MDQPKYKRWLEKHPNAVLNCKICGEPLPMLMVVELQEFHNRCLKLKHQKTRIEMAVHAGEPYRHTVKPLR